MPTICYRVNDEVYDPATSTSVYYEYDSFGTLRSVKDTNGDWVSYEADARGRRVIKKINGTRVAAWLWSDDLRPVAELDGSNQVQKRFIYARGVNSPELMVTAGGESYVIARGQVWRWSFAGYSHVSESLADARLLTPPSIVNALRAGYRAQIGLD